MLETPEARSPTDTPERRRTVPKRRTILRVSFVDRSRKETVRLGPKGEEVEVGVVWRFDWLLEPVEYHLTASAIQGVTQEIDRYHQALMAEDDAARLAWWTVGPGGFDFVVRLEHREVWENWLARGLKDFRHSVMRTTECGWCSEDHPDKAERLTHVEERHKERFHTCRYCNKDPKEFIHLRGFDKIQIATATKRTTISVSDLVDGLAEQVLKAHVRAHEWERSSFFEKHSVVNEIFPQGAG